MAAYAIAHLHDADPHPDVAEYMERITSTFEPFGGHFLVHGAPPEVKEGAWLGHVVINGFPGIAGGTGDPGILLRSTSRSGHLAP
ncbi:DUF1330 domain-containing protein [Cellulosimicrobium terreum]|nr:DUF1330 domain-containing protein [Cellulosimicrobium terreum]